MAHRGESNWGSILAMIAFSFWVDFEESLIWFTVIFGGILFWVFVTAPILQAIKNARARAAK